jgi:hypothetical protein
MKFKIVIENCVIIIEKVRDIRRTATTLVFLSYLISPIEDM